MTVIPGEGKLSRHYGLVIQANSRSGPGRGAAPEPPERYWWLRWRMFDALMWDAIDALTAEAADALTQRWPDDWPSPTSGLLSIRQMEWVRVTMIDGRELDPVGRLFV